MYCGHAISDLCIHCFITQIFIFSSGRDPLAGLNHWKDINAVAGLLRVYFRELEDPLFPGSHYQEFIKASCKYDKSLYIRAVLKLKPKESLLAT